MKRRLGARPAGRKERRLARKYWLMKSEPDVYSIDDLEEQGRTPWEGVRNYQARNSLRDDLKKGDLVLFYHSNAKPPGVAETVKWAQAATLLHDQGTPWPAAFRRAIGVAIKDQDDFTYLGERIDRKQPGAHAIIDVVGVIGDIVG